MPAPPRLACAALLLGALLSAASGAEPPSTGGVVMSAARVFAQQGGMALYGNVCAGCHMADGKGAVGAGFYPSLAGNEKLETAAYPVYVLLFGLRGMPPVGRLMTDRQVADVVNYVRTHFGNGYDEPVAPADVAALRP